MEDAKDYGEIEGLIADIRKACGNGKAVFRGEYLDYKGTAVSSGLYRKHKDKDSGIFDDDHHYQPGDVEKEIVEKARQGAFPAGTSTVDILTDLQHFGAHTAVVDFTKDFLVALFFACNGEPKKGEEHSPGRVWVLPRKGIKELDPDRIHDESRPEMGFITPGQTAWSRSRVENQSSIFVHARSGRVDEKHMKYVEIPHKLKQACLAYLEKFHDISDGTIYNDLIGFIQNEENFKTARLNFYKSNRKVAIGDSKAAMGDHDGAIKHYNEAIKDYDKVIDLHPNSPTVLNKRGIAKKKLGNSKAANEDHTGAIKHYKDAIKDYDKVIRLRPDYPAAFYNKGIAKRKLGNSKAANGDHTGAIKHYEDAIKDYDEAIRLRPDYPAAFNNRGNAKRKLGKHEDAIKDYDEAIRLRPDYPAALKNRAQAKRKLGK